LAALFALAGLAAAEDTPKAAATRMKLKDKVTVDYKDTLIKDVATDLMEQVKGLSIILDTARGVSLNRKITYQAADKPLEEVLDEVLKKEGFGYVVISGKANARDGALQIKQGDERGYPKGQEPKAAGDTPDPNKPKAPARPAVKAPARPAAPAKPPEKKDEKAEGEAKAEGATKPDKKEEKAEGEAKAETKPDKAEGEAKAEGDKTTEDTPEEKEAGRKVKFAKELVAAKKVTRARERLEEIVRRYPMTRAADEAKKLLDELKK
jgi:hypothetical protein